MSFFDFHVHSHYSRDANMVPDRLIRVALKQGLRGIAITDHNTIAGGVQAQKTCGRPFVVVVGAEIRTAACEIIGLFLTDEISSTDPLTVIDEIKSQDGITVLPHPFRSTFPPAPRRRRGLPPDLLSKIDVIEAFNARSTVQANQHAFALAATLGKPTIAGSDAHWYREVGRAKTWVAPFASEDDLRRHLLAGRTRIEATRNTFPQSTPFLVLSTLYGRLGRRSQRHRVSPPRQRPATNT
jgi:predicted metal-dependent phosphoesterase TrpH